MPSKVLVAKVLMADMRHGTCVKAVDVSCAKPSNAASAKAAYVTATKATHVTSTKAAHVASTAHAAAHPAAVAAATTTTAASGLGARGKQQSVILNPSPIGKRDFSLARIQADRSDTEI